MQNLSRIGKMKFMDCSLVLGRGGSSAQSCASPSQNTHTNTGYVVEKYPRVAKLGCENLGPYRQQLFWVITGIWKMIICNVVINKHENICVGVYWYAYSFVTPRLPLRP